MKTKLSKNRFDEDLNKIRKVMNSLIFLKPIVPHTNFEEIVNLLIFDYIALVQQMGLFKAIKGFDDSNPSGIAVFETAPREKHVDIAKKYTAFFSEVCSSGVGFAPKIILEGPESVKGFNCLGRALSLGAYLTLHKVFTYFVQSVDHAMCMVEEREHKYLCDPGSGKVFKMHGKFVAHDGYSWYVASPKDKFHFRYLVIQSLGSGGLNAIFQSFEFLKNIGWRKKIIKNPLFEDCEKDLLNIMDPKFGYRNQINSIDWKNFRATLFGYLDDHRTRYEREWLLEEERIRIRREHFNGVRERFDRAAFNACCATGFIGKVSDFHQKMFLVISPVADEVMRFLESSEELQVAISDQYRTYFSILKEIVSQDKELKQYALEKFRAKLFDIQYQF